jgi:4-hydroxybenzoate polyprenyltransferase
MQLQSLLNRIVNYAFFAACCATAMVYQSYIFFKIPANIYLIAFVFFATICSYNFHFFLAKNNQFLKNSSLKWLLLNTHLQLILLAFIGMSSTFFLSKLPIHTIVFSIVCTIAYSLPLLPFVMVEGLKKAGFLKTILLAFTWAYVTVYLPAATTNIVNKIWVFWFVQRFVFILILCIIFDNRDAVTDKIKGLHSLATDIPKNIINILVAVLLLVSLVLHYKSIYFGASMRQACGLQYIAALVLLVYIISLKKRGYLFYYCIVDGLMIVSAIVSTLASI